MIAGTVLLMGLLGSGVVQANDDVRYGYCSTSYGESTNPHYVVSSVFRIKNGIYHVGVQNSFRSYVNAEFGTLSDSPNCSILYASYQEAADKRNDEISQIRNRFEFPVHTVHWSYYGD
ncbi:hypothetical protein CDG60_16035 [Acinetobacter chinensis]|uniref:Uncharacterized protein n=2 Tax=Acinetobacter chinensis TaxID=2004650 RepID=A0A3B7M290_9GAMM|nr:hypothetical protein CDG60_16035 [Acinetobacter chinensis]